MKRETATPSPTQAEVRDRVAEAIRKALPEIDGLTILDDGERVGPLGGRSVQILLALDVGDEVLGVAINVYADDNIEASLDATLAAKRAARDRTEARREAIAEMAP